MKIGIEAQRIFRKKKHGMDMVALELIRNLQQIDTENEYVIFVKSDEDNTVIKETANFKIVELKGGSYPLWEQVALPKAAAKQGCQLLHCTSNTAPIFCNIPLVVTLHDIIYMESSAMDIVRSGGSNYQKFGNIYRRLIVPKLVRKSKKIITVSNFEKDCIGKFFGMQTDSRLTTVYNGVSEYFQPVTDAGILKTVKEKYNLPDNYVFFLGNTHPKKNTKGTLAAFSQFLKQTGSDMKLVMIDYDRTELEKLLQEIGDAELMNNIVLTGYIVNQDLPAIYAQSQLFLYPSLRESFGIPLIEAMACGVPVITSNTSSMPEIAGDAAILIDPYNPDEITAAMIKVFNGNNLRTTMINDGMAQAAKFSWKAMAQDVLKIYNEIGKQ
jgi:glycosyltransferase involved in cell wall biosynthesis